MLLDNALHNEDNESGRSLGPRLFDPHCTQKYLGPSEKIVSFKVSLKLQE